MLRFLSSNLILQVQGLLEDAFLDFDVLSKPLAKFLEAVKGSLQVDGQAVRVARKTLAPVRPLLKRLAFDADKEPVLYSSPTAVKLIGLAALELVPREGDCDVHVAIQLGPGTFKKTDLYDNRFVCGLCMGWGGAGLYLEECGVLMHLLVTLHHYFWAF